MSGLGPRGAAFGAQKWNGFRFNRNLLWVAGQQGMSPAFLWPSLTDRRSPDRRKKRPVRATLLNASYKLGP